VTPLGKVPPVSKVAIDKDNEAGRSEHDVRASGEGSDMLIVLRSWLALVP
jgi:hypothetical protein